MIQTALIEIFSSRPEKFMDGNKVKGLLRLKLGYLPIDSEYYSEFKSLRDTYIGENGRRILKFWAQNHWVYCFSNNPENIKKHNYACDKLSKNALSGKIAYTG